MFITPGPTAAQHHADNTTDADEPLGDIAQPFVGQHSTILPLAGRSTNWFLVAADVAANVTSVESAVGGVEIHFVEHGAGTPALVLHGAGVDHREAEACFEPGLSAHGGLRRIFPDLPGMGRTHAPAALQSADDVLDVLIGFAEQVGDGQSVLLVGHSAGGYYAHGLAARRPDLVAGLALVCPLLAAVRDVPEHRPVVAGDNLGDEEFRSYFVVQTAATLERYERFVAPAIPLVDAAAMDRIGQHWQLRAPDRSTYEGPTLIIAGRQDSTVGYAAAVDQLERYPSATLAVLDGAGHALPHEQPEALAELIRGWLSRVDADASRRLRDSEV